MKKTELSKTETTADSSRKKAKKILIIIILSIVGVMAVLGIASVIIDTLTKNDKKEFEVDYNFYPADYEENIFENERYLALIGEEFIKYTDSATNVTVGIDKESAYEQGIEVQFIVDMLYDAINGDHEAYNARFSDTYYEDHLPKERFTMQKIYDVNITYVSSEKISDGNYTKSIYCIEYKIYENNGTFRRDIGDGSKKQYFTLSTYSDGTILVDGVSTVNIAKK